MASNTLFSDIQFKRVTCFSKAYRHFGGRIPLTYKQFYFFWYLFVDGFSDRLFRPSDVLLTGGHGTLAFHFIKILRQKGYLAKNGKNYSMTDKAFKDMKEFMGHYDYLCSQPFSWK